MLNVFGIPRAPARRLDRQRRVFAGKRDLLNFLQTSTETPLRDRLKTVERIAFTFPKEEIVEIRRNV